MSSQDEKFMHEALRLAKKGLGSTFPNPAVGAVLIKNGKIIGRGFHKKAGMPHAEAEAFANTTEDPKGATIYVTLEPCSIFGRTSPCADTIIANGITHVICCSVDPNPKVRGNGIQKLEANGITVNVGLFSEKARELNEGFFIYHELSRPFVAIKFAASLDGKIATKTNDSKWITNEKARNYARNLRGQYQAIVVGINTVLFDNPHLAAAGEREPLRIILDSTLKIPFGSDVLRDNNVLLVTTKRADRKKADTLQQKGIEIIRMNQDEILIPDLLAELYRREIISIFVEGGGGVLGSFADSKIVDKIYAFYAPILVGGTEAVSALKGVGIVKISDALKIERPEVKILDTNFLITGSFTH